MDTLTEHDSVQRLIARLDSDTRNRDPRTVCAAVKATLSEEIRSGRLRLPAEVLATDTRGYARHLLHKAADDGYAVVIMVWAPGQETPIHDHDDKWCVECVYQGRIRVESYDLLDTAEDGSVAFRRAEEIEAERGIAGSLIPPFDYHIIANPNPETAVTIHVYGGEMESCRMFEPRADGRYERRHKPLSYTS